MRGREVGAHGGTRAWIVVKWSPRRSPRGSAIPLEPSRSVGIYSTALYILRRPRVRNHSLPAARSEYLAGLGGMGSGCRSGVAGVLSA